VLRANILDTQNEDFIRTARSKGIHRTSDYWLRHTLRHVHSTTFVRLFVLYFGVLVAGGALLLTLGCVRHPRGRLRHLSSLANLDLPDDHGHRLYGAFLHRAGQRPVVDICDSLARPEDPPHDGEAMTATRCLTCVTLKVSFRTEDGLVTGRRRGVAHPVGGRDARHVGELQDPARASTHDCRSCGCG